MLQTITPDRVDLSGILATGRRLRTQRREFPEFVYEIVKMNHVDLYARETNVEGEEELILLRQDFVQLDAKLRVNEQGSVDATVENYIAKQIELDPRNPFPTSQLATWWATQGCGASHMDYKAEHKKTKRIIEGSVKIRYKTHRISASDIRFFSSSGTVVH